MTSATIPQCDPRAGYLARKREVDAAIESVLTGGQYILGQQVDAFEREFAAFSGVAHGVGVASGTDAIELALRACGIGVGDVVVTVSHTAVATVAAIERAGAIPFLADIDPVSYTISPDAFAAAICHNKGRIRAVIPVHLYGHPAAMGEIVRLAREHEIKVIEDCAQAHGASLDDRRVGGWGDAAAFSFYPTKNLGAFGDGGIVVTGDARIADRVRLLRQYGWRQRYVSDMPGANSRLDEIQAAVLRVGLRCLEGDNGRRRDIARAYDDGLADANLERPLLRQGVAHVYHQYVVRHARRDQLQKRLKDKGIMTAVHYPAPVHLQPSYHGRIPCGDLSATERLIPEVLSLPMFPQLSDSQVSVVIATLRECAAQA